MYRVSHPFAAEKPACVISDPCLAKEPCENLGTCSVVRDRAVCSCTPAWRGEHCQLPARPCGAAPEPCGSRFRCSREPETPAGLSCNCDRRPGWAAKSGEVTGRGLRREGGN